MLFKQREDGVVLGNQKDQIRLWGSNGTPDATIEAELL